MRPGSDMHLKVFFFKSNIMMLLEMRICRRHVSNSAKASSKRPSMVEAGQTCSRKAKST